MASCALKRDQDVNEKKRLNTGSFDANSGWGTISLFVVEEIMLYLDLPDILESSRVCSHWYSVVEDETFWKKLLKVHRKLGVDNLEPDLFYKRLYKMEHAKAVISSSHAHHRLNGEYEGGEYEGGIDFSNSGEYVSVRFYELVILWRKNEHTGSFEIFNEIMPFDGHEHEEDDHEHDKDTGEHEEADHYNPTNNRISYTSFNESDDCILIVHGNCSFDPGSNVMVYSMPATRRLLKKALIVMPPFDDNNAPWEIIESVCWFDRYTFLVKHNKMNNIVFTLYSVNEEFEPNIIYTTNHHLKYDVYPALNGNMMAVNEDNKGEKKIVFYTVTCEDDYHEFCDHDLHILTVTSDFSGELVGPNTSTSLTERKSLDPNHYSCSSNITKRIDFQIRQFNGEFPDKMAMVCLPKFSDNRGNIDLDYYNANVEIRLYDFELNLLRILYTQPINLFIERSIKYVLSPEVEYFHREWKVYLYLDHDQCFILNTYNVRNPAIMKYFDMKHEVVLDIVTGNTERIDVAAFSPKNADILCSLTADGLVKFFDFSV